MIKELTKKYYYLYYYLTYMQTLCLNYVLLTFASYIELNLLKDIKVKSCLVKSIELFIPFLKMGLTDLGSLKSKRSCTNYHTFYINSLIKAWDSAKKFDLVLTK